MSDLLHQNINTVGSIQSKKPVTIASASTIAPTTFLSFISGTTQLVTVTPPVTGSHMLCFVFTGSMGVFSTGGNLAVATDPVVNVPVFLVYDPLTAKYYTGRTTT